MLTLELGVTHPPSRCSCCGAKSVNLTGYVYADGNPRAVYFAGLGEGHPDRAIQLAVGIGQWGEGAAPADRLGFTMVLRNGPTVYEVMVVNPQESPWQHVSLIGPILSREAALQHPLIQEAFHITDHLVTDDPRIKAYLGSGALPAPNDPGA